MSHMAARSDIVRAGATPEFVTLCKTLYGDAVDPDVIWQTVIKASPDQADVHAQRSKARGAFERSTNAVGIGSGTVALGSAMHDDRLKGKDAGKLANKLYATGEKLTEALPKGMRLSDKEGKAGAGLALGALGLHTLNNVGDVAIGGTLRTLDKNKLQPTGRQRGVKAASMEMPLSEGLLPKFKDVVEGTKKQGATIAGKLQATGQVAPTPLPGAPGVAAPSAGAPGAAVPGAAAPGAAKPAAAGPAKAKPAPGKNPKAVAKSSPDVVWQGTFSKFDDDKHLAFGWASVSKVDGMPVVDKQGDYIDPGDLEDAAYEYMLKSRIGGAMHARDPFDKPVKVADIVESMVFTDDKVAKMGLPEDFNRGWWIGMKIHDPAEWSLVRKGGDGGGRGGFSIHGRGIRKSQDVDDLMGYTA